ncbi:PTS lactose/cellobiose transporter subunit IIA [Amphibacillus sp. Q70]|uniref:PTS lactose/cellobiose transporter subunit IIA n=1 Tax=Amphibacillus sp. Q70 TaxID=3453416 RepID=UPI003F84B8C6
MDNEIAEISMKIILNAGNARENINNAIKYLINDDLEGYEREIKEANENIRKAHLQQTEVIQSEAAGKEIGINLLFIHAQDTLMTIMSEHNMMKSMFLLYQSINEKVKSGEDKT